MTSYDPPYPTGSIAVQHEDGHPVLSLSGEIDAGVVAEFQRSVAGALPQVVAVDAEHVTFMSSGGIALLARVTDDLRRAGGRPVLRRPARSVQLVLGVTGVDRLFDVRR